MPRTNAAAPPLARDTAVLTALFLTSGTTHLVRPQVFEALIPASLPNHRAVNYVTGLAELLCAAGLLHPSTRRAAGYASAVLLVGVFPGNVQMCLTYARRARRRQDTASRVALAASIVRLPLQAPLVRAALRATGH